MERRTGEGLWAISVEPNHTQMVGGHIYAEVFSFHFHFYTYVWPAWIKQRRNVFTVTFVPIGCFN